MLSCDIHLRIYSANSRARKEQIDCFTYMLYIHTALELEQGVFPSLYDRFFHQIMESNATLKLFAHMNHFKHLKEAGYFMFPWIKVSFSF